MANSETKLLTVPIISLFVFIIGTYFPLIYNYIPILGKLRAVLVSGIVMIVSYILTKNDYTNTDVYKNPIFLSLICFLFVLTIGIFVSFDRGATLDLILLNAKYFLVMAVMVKIIDTEKRLDLLLGVFTVCGVGMALVSILNYVTGQTSNHSGYVSATALNIGIFGDPNDLALLYNITLPFLLFFLVKAKKKLLPSVGVILILTAIMLTFSRGGFVGLCTVGFGFSIFHARKQKKYLLYLLILILPVYFFAPPEYNERIASIFNWEVNQETGETGTRMDAWRLVFSEGIKHHPVLGVGAGCSLYIAGQSMSDWHYIHNSFIQIFSELGLLGLLFYIRLYYLPYKQYRTAVKLKYKDDVMQLLRYRMIIVSFFTYAVTVVFLPQAYSPILYTLVGIAIIQAQLSDATQSAIQVGSK